MLKKPEKPQESICSVDPEAYIILYYVRLSILCIQHISHICRSFFPKECSQKGDILSFIPSL